MVTAARNQEPNDAESQTESFALIREERRTPGGGGGECSSFSFICCPKDNWQKGVLHCLMNASTFQNVCPTKRHDVSRAVMRQVDTTKGLQNGWLILNLTRHRGCDRGIQGYRLMISESQRNAAQKRVRPRVR